MICEINGNIVKLKQNDLTIELNYLDIINNINKEIKTPFYLNKTNYIEYYFNRNNKKLATSNNYKNSLKEIISLVDNICKGNFNLFNYLHFTINGYFDIDYVKNIATPILGLKTFINNIEYIMIPSLRLDVKEKDYAIISFDNNCVQKLDTFKPLFIFDYVNPRNYVSINPIMLKTGMIYSTKFNDKYFLYLGNPYIINNDSYTLKTYKQSKSEITLDDISDKYLLNQFKVNKILNSKLIDFQYIYCELTYDEFKEIKNLNKKEDFEDFIKTNYSKFLNRSSIFETPIVLYNEEYQYLKNCKSSEIIIKKDITKTKIPYKYFENNVYLIEYAYLNYIINKDIILNEGINNTTLNKAVPCDLIKEIINLKDKLINKNKIVNLVYQNSYKNDFENITKNEYHLGRCIYFLEISELESDVKINSSVAEFSNYGKYQGYCKLPNGADIIVLKDYNKVKTCCMIRVLYFDGKQLKIFTPYEGNTVNIALNTCFFNENILKKDNINQNYLKQIYPNGLDLNQKLNLNFENEVNMGYAKFLGMDYDDYMSKKFHLNYDTICKEIEDVLS